MAKKKVADTEAREVLEQIVLDLGRLQGLAKSKGETFVAFLIASAQREAGVRCEEVMGVKVDAPSKAKAKRQREPETQAQ